MEKYEIHKIYIYENMYIMQTHNSKVSCVGTKFTFCFLILASPLVKMSRDKDWI